MQSISSDSLGHKELEPFLQLPWNDLAITPLWCHRFVAAGIAEQPNK